MVLRERVNFQMLHLQRKSFNMSLSMLVILELMVTGVKLLVKLIKTQFRTI